VYQHATFEFALSGLSRQVVWCFLHAFPFYNSEQQSQRYVRLDAAQAHVPRRLAGEALELYEASVERSFASYHALARCLEPVTQRTLAELWRLKDRQSVVFARNLAREAQKRAIETARYVLPIACHTAMVYTVSGIVLHRLRRMAAACDAPDEARAVVEAMIGEVEKRDPAFFSEIGEPPLADDEVPERLAAPGPSDPHFAARFDRSLEGHRSRLVDYGAQAQAVVASAVRSVLGRPDLAEDEALNMVLNPARNRYRLDTLNVSTHSPLMRTLEHAHYTFRKKLSHSADSQDQRHRMVPGSRPMLSRTLATAVDVIEPALVAEDPAAHTLFRESVEDAFHTRAELLRRGVAPELALYVLPNAVSVRFEESGSLLHLLHKWTMRTCLNAQREIWEASMDELAQVRGVHPQLVRHVGPPCVVRGGLVAPRCTEGTHFCGVPVWRSFPEIERKI
jgi:thymidylate synthase ThyX